MSRQEELDNLIKSLVPILMNGEVTVERITGIVENPVVGMLSGLHDFQPPTEEEKAWLKQELSERLLHVRDIKACVFSEDYEPWLDNARSNIEFRFWKDYYDHLIQTAKFDKDAADSIDRATDMVLDRCGDPRKVGLGLRKGLVVGNVQSGKTADYIGVITKAADAGYRVIIVLAGLLNNLRSQTQGRVDAGFVGVSKEEVPRESGGGYDMVERLVGVGLTNGSARPLSVLSLTTLHSDFTARTAKTVTSTHGIDDSTVYIAVAKKNTSTLKALIKWFGKSLCSKPMLLIDDEADNASVNYRDYDSPTTINRLIRELLGKFPRATYLGYTATPFANIFIDPDITTSEHGEDLFPRDFVVALDAPDHYMGPKRIFGSDVKPEDDIVREITDNGDVLPLKHKRDLCVTYLPESLIRALRLYVLSTAIRMARGDVTCHASALINVSRLIAVHCQVSKLVKEEVRRIQEAIEVYGNLPYDRNALMTDFHQLYEDECSGCNVEWETVRDFLYDAARPIEVLEIHMGGDSSSLNYSRQSYPNGRKVIAIGGFSLSRGLTLEGLSVSYLIRNSRMYDTLMQMGRWFGYRRGYGDVCRIFLTEEERSWYEHITSAMEELWQEFKEMEAEKLTPAQFGLRVRAHPLNLIVTAVNKMRNTVEMTVKVDLAGRHIEPNVFNISDLHHNRKVLDRLLSDIGMPNADASPCFGYYWKGVSSRRIQSFVKETKRLDVNIDTASGPVCEFLEKLAIDGIDTCDVYLASTGEMENLCSLGGVTVGRESFSVLPKYDGTIVVGGGKKHVTSKDQERAGLEAVLSTEDVKQAIEDYKAENCTESVPGRFYRRYRERPVLILHVINGKVEEGAPKPTVDCSEIVVWRLVFPGEAVKYRPDRLVSYVLNMVAARQYNHEEFEEEAMEEC